MERAIRGILRRRPIIEIHRDLKRRQGPEWAVGLHPDEERRQRVIAEDLVADPQCPPERSVRGDRAESRLQHLLQYQDPVGVKRARRQRWIERHTYIRGNRRARITDDQL